ncbi:AbrB/MazE/SpoVT family DNA-binding domain-containing protein [soil metagenome]
MSTRVTVKGQVTLPKSVRDAVGIKPGDLVDVRATSAGGVIIEKPEREGAYLERLKRLAKRRLFKGTTDDLMRETRGDPDEDPPLSPAK